MLPTSSGPEWQFHIATDILVVKYGNFTLLMIFSGQEWQLADLPPQMYHWDIYYGMYLAAILYLQE